MAQKKKHRKKKKGVNTTRLLALLAIIVAIVLVVVVIVFVVKNKATSNSTEEITTETEETEAEEAEEDGDFFDHESGVSYLTGTPLSEELVEKRPFAVMIENTKEALPQYGISQAGVIYECPVEGSYTRMMAIFDDYEDIPKIGNVRSCRDYFAYIAREYEAIYAHFGQSIYAKVGVLASGLIDNLNGLDGDIGSVVYYRSSDKAAPHNVYTTPEMLIAGAQKRGYSLTHTADYTGHFKFAETTNTLEDGAQAYVIKPYYFYNKPYFIYNEDDHLYYRYEFGAKQVDANTGDQLAVTNIIYQYVPSSKYDATEYLNIPTVGAGAGAYFSQGRAIEINWYKENETSATIYFDTNGNVLEINPGMTWICFIENDYIDKDMCYTNVEDFKN